MMAPPRLSRTLPPQRPVIDMVPSATAPQQLITYTFPPGADFGGLLVGALQRLESGGALRILDVLFVARGEDPAPVQAVALHSDTAAGMIGQLIGFRMDESARAEETERALKGPAGDLVRELSGALEPGCALAAVLVEHVWAKVLGDAVERVGGSALGNEVFDASESERAWSRVPAGLAALSG